MRTLRLPAQFRKENITAWLTSNNTCPVCRHQLPEETPAEPDPAQRHAARAAGAGAQPAAPPAPADAASREEVLASIPGMSGMQWPNLTWPPAEAIDSDDSETDEEAVAAAIAASVETHRAEQAQRAQHDAEMRAAYHQRTLHAPAEPIQPDTLQLVVSNLELLSTAQLLAQAQAEGLPVTAAMPRDALIATLARHISTVPATAANSAAAQPMPAPSAPRQASPPRQPVPSQFEPFTSKYPLPPEPGSDARNTCTVCLQLPGRSKRMVRRFFPHDRLGQVLTAAMQQDPVAVPPPKPSEVLPFRLRLPTQGVAHDLDETLLSAGISEGRHLICIERSRP